MKSIGARMWMFLVLGLAAAAFPAGVCGQPVDGGADNGRPGDKRSTDGTGVVFDRDFAPAEGWIKPQEAPYRAEICLNGRWDFQVAELPDDWRPDQGKAPNLGLPQDDAWDAVKIKIPSPWNVNSIMMDRTSQGMDSRTFPSYPQRWDRVRMGWLKKAVTVPAAWRDKRIYLHLEAVAGWCDIFINRRPVGSHFDTSLPAEVDVTPLVQCGQENEILLAVRDARLFSAKGTYGSFTYPTGSFWLADAVGVWQDVYLLARP
ncbi:MAG: hypothetical protein JW810_13335, partial [Sedimentisphaerales bacterium]|nr:hypothetical protein [Sedimentisphaerales bacterium]